MGETTKSGSLAAETECIGDALELLHLEACVGIDGSYATISLHTMGGQIDLAITSDQMPAAVAEIREAGDTMMRRQIKSKGKGRSFVQEMMRAAPRPVTIVPMFDPVTGDCVVFCRFHDRMPQIIRLSIEQLYTARATFDEEIKLHCH